MYIVNGSGGRGSATRIYIHIFFCVEEFRVTPLTTGQRSVFGGGGEEEEGQRLGHFPGCSRWPLEGMPFPPPPYPGGYLTRRTHLQSRWEEEAFPPPPQRESSGGYEHEECVSSDPSVESFSSGCDPRVRSRGHHAQAQDCIEEFQPLLQKFIRTKVPPSTHVVKCWKG